MVKVYLNKWLKLVPPAVGKMVITGRSKRLGAWQLGNQILDLDLIWILNIKSESKKIQLGTFPP